MASFPPPGPVAAFCDDLLAHDLPDLDGDRRAEVVAFAGRRIAGLPSPMRIGVGLVAVAVAAAGRVLGGPRLARFLAGRSLPVFGEYVRLVRSLGYAYVWETWPATTPTGGAGPPEAAGASVRRTWSAQLGDGVRAHGARGAGRGG